MNKEHIKYFSMFTEVQSTIDASAAIWSPVPAMSVLKNELDEIIQRVEALYGDNFDDSTSITRQKGNYKEVMINKLMILISAVTVLGELNEQEDLLAFKGLSKSDLAGTKELELVNTALAVIKTVRANQEALADMGISEAQITETETSIDDFKQLIGQARQVRNSVYANIKEADQLIDAGNVLLRNKMDKLIKIFALKEPKFFDLYQRARVIIN